jgi:two-component system sensor histidine kinase PilS (NtrC family)
MTLGNAETTRSPDRDNIPVELRQRVSFICFFRLIFLVLLILPLALSDAGETVLSDTLKIVQQGHYVAFLVSGFGLTLFFLLTWKRFTDVLFLFRLQLGADFALCSYLILLTGGVTSYFFFLYLGIIFLYGRLLGLSTAKRITVATFCLTLVLAFLQYQQPVVMISPPLDLRQAMYYPVMQLIALLLITSLLRMGYTSEDQLLHELARKQQQLQRSEELKTKVFDWMNSALLVVDPRGYISVMNQSALELAGVKDYPAALGRHLREIFPPLAELWQEWDKTSHNRTETIMGERTLGATLGALPENMGSLILFSDITEIKALQDQVKQMEKMASLGELAAGLAHELKNPLAGIKASLQLTQQNTVSEEQRHKLQGVVQKDIERMDNLVKEFLAFARPEEADPRQISLAKVLRECLDNLNQLHPEVRFEIDPAVEDASWYWDPEQLQRILMNLLLNAGQACADHPNPEVRIGLDQDRSGEILSIADNGPGLDPEMEERIFHPFVTSKQNGSGLGLSIALRLANQNGSHLSLHNRPLGGTEARLYAPRKGTQEEEP